MLRPRAAVLSICVLAVCLLAVPAQGAVSPHSLRKPVTDENFYFVMADRFENGDAANDHGGIAGGRLQDGFDPTAKGFYHGGDLQGLLERIDYIKGLGTDSIWLTPSFRTRPSSSRTGRVPATTATGSPTSRRSTPTWARTRTCGRSSTPPTPAG